MKKYPKISIITPSFNQGKYIEETIQSIINQNYPNLEYIIIDGGSKDSTVEIIRKYEEKIDYWISEPDNGQSHAINKGFKKATGEIINWINSDDLLASDALFKIADAFIKNPDAQFIYGQNVHIKNNKNCPLVKNPKSNLPAHYFYGFPYAQQACFYKYSLLVKYGYIDENYSFTMDYDLFVRFAAHIKFHQIDNLISYFRWHDESKTLTISHIAEKEKLKVFSCLLFSINYTMGIKLLKELDLWLKPIKKYSYSVDFLKNTENHPQIVFGFLIPYLIKWHVNANFIKVRIVILYFEKNKEYLKINTEIKRIILIYKLPVFIIKLIRKIKNQSYAHSLYNSRIPT